MDNLGLQFFCKLCRNEKDTNSEVESAFCMPHSVRKFKKGEYIAYQGDEVAHLYMLARGRVKTEIVSDTGLSLPIEVIQAPYPLAAAFLFAERNRFPVDVIALEDCEITMIRKETIEKQIAACPEFLRGFMAFTANRMQFLSDRLKIFSLKSIKSKLAFYIMQHLKHDEFELGQSIASLAEYFGVERPSLSRVIAELQSEGIIWLKSGKGKILNREAFKRIL